MKIAITGGTGFVGKNLSAYLNVAGFDLVNIDRAKLNNISPIDLENCDVVLHLAGKAHYTKKNDMRKVYHEVNYELTKKVYDAYLISQARIFIFLSSVKAAVDHINTTLDEDFIPRPNTEYGRSKLMAEQYINMQDLPEGKFFYILRPCMIHGPESKGNLNMLFETIRRGIPYPLAAFENQRSYLSIGNLCFLIGQLITRKDPIPSGIYHVADDSPLSTNEVVSILSAAVNRQPKLWRVPKKLISFVAKIGDALGLPFFNTERLEKLTENYVVSNRKIKKALAVKLPLNATEGMRSTADSLKSDKYNTN